MSNFNNKSITANGLNLISGAISGGSITFTRIVMGDGSYIGDIGLITELVSQKQSLNISSITRNGSQATLSSTLTQADITEGFYWKEVGVYAKGDDDIEVLYLYGSATEASYIGPDMLNEKIINVGVLVGNTSNISAVIDSSLVFLTSQDLSDHDSSTTCHSKLRSWVQGLFDSITLTWENIVGKPTLFPPEEHKHDDRYYTEGEVDSKLSNKLGKTETASSASKVVNSLTLKIAGITKNTYNGSSAQSFDVAAATTSSAGVMTKEQVTQLNTNTTDISNLKSTVISGKTSVANAINDKLGTTLSNKTSFSDFAYYIINFLIKKITVFDSVITAPSYDEYKDLHLASFVLNSGTEVIYNKSGDVLYIFRCQYDYSTSTDFDVELVGTVTAGGRIFLSSSYNTSYPWVRQGLLFSPGGCTVQGVKNMRVMA